jgi:predicted dehydrogenase
MNVLIIGLGSIGKKHIKVLRNILNDINIYALRSSKVASQYEDIINIGALADLNNIKIDFAIISNPTSLHIEKINELLVLNCPIFIEKPLSNNLNIGKIKEKVIQSGVMTYVACNLRFLHSLKFIKEKLEKGEKRLNEVNIYCGSYLPDWRPGNFLDYYSTNVALGGGVHFDLIHELDYTYWMFGEPINVVKTLSKKSTLNINVYDYANYILSYKDFTVSIILNYYRRESKRSFDLIFDDETWEVDLLKNKICSGNNILFQSNQTITETYLDQMKYFISILKNSHLSSNNTIEDSYKVLKICLC